MTEIQIIKELIERYKGKNLNEADTRFKIVDEILEKILKWPKEPTCCEVYINGNRADYILYNKASKPILIIETKKAAKYFELPTNLNSTNNYQKILVEKLLTDDNIKEAILQVKEYTEDLGCNYSCITNGFTWIFFQVSATNGVSWKKLPAFVINNINFFDADYTVANNFLSYTNLIENSSLKKNIGVSRVLYSEIFYPKTNITTYNSPVNSNIYASILNNISRKYLGNITFDNAEFIEKCYVTNKGHFDDLQKNMHGVIYDSLTPFFKSEGVKDFDDDRKGGLFALKVQEIIKKQNLDNVMILFGGRGSGKSTFIKRLLYHIKPREIDAHSIIAVVDLIDSAQIPEELTKEIWNKALINIDKKNILKGSKEDLLKLFSDKFEIFEKQVLQGFDKTSSEYNTLINNFLIENKGDIKYCCERLSFNWKAKSRGLIIVLDNLDQLPPNLQDVCFLNAVEIAKKLSCLVIISMREERYFNAKTKGVLDAYHIPGFHLTSPVIPDVIYKRLSYIIATIKSTPDVDFEFGINNKSKLKTILSFLEICKKEIARKSSDLSKFLRYSTHGDVRQALDFFKGFLTSGYTNINEMAPHEDWKFQIHQVVKPMMIPDRFFFDERTSKMSNLYQLRNDTNSSHFTGLRILTHLDNKSMEKTNSGFLDVKFLIQKFENEYDLKIDCEKNIDIFLQKGVIEANNRLEEFSEKVDQVRITAFGKYLLDFLAFDFTYLDLVSLDCGIYSEKLNSQFIRAAHVEHTYYYDGNFYDRITSRLKRVERFIEYLTQQENKEFEELSLPATAPKFSLKLKEYFNKQQERVLKSANNRLNGDY